MGEVSLKDLQSLARTGGSAAHKLVLDALRRPTAWAVVEEPNGQLCIEPVRWETDDEVEASLRSEDLPLGA